MTAELTADDRRALEQLEGRLRTLLPPEYQETYEAVQPVSMGSAGLKYAGDGTVAWDQMWGSFCDLAMAGGPPHKGMLLGPGTEAEVDAQFGLYDAVVDEITRGIRMVTGLRAYPSPALGWVSVTCTGDTMAEWLLRAIAMENVAVRRAGATLELPAAPHFRLEKGIKNVITVIAKTAHYWLGHMPPAQQREIGDLFMRMTAQRPLVEPDSWERVEEGIGTGRIAGAGRIEQSAGLPAAPPRYAAWLGFECPDVRSAVWIMRGLVGSNVLARREARTLFVPINRSADPDGALVATAIAQVHGFARARGILQTRL